MRSSWRVRLSLVLLVLTGATRAADDLPTAAAEALNVFAGLESESVLLRLDTALSAARRSLPAPVAKAGLVPGDELKLIAADPGAGFQCGFSVAVDGRRAVVGAMGHDVNGSYSGAAYVFEYDGVGWNEVARLAPSDGAAWDFFGWAVAVSGSSVLVGAFGDDGEGGAAYVFTWNGNAWVEEQKLVPGDSTAGQDFGISVMLQGNRAVVGAFGDTESGGAYAGAAYVFDRVGASWSQSAKLRATGGAAGDNFGVSVGLDGDRAIVGADGYDGVGSASGAAYVFDYDGSSWNQQARLLAGDASAGAFFGGAVAVRGNRAAVGASTESSTAANSGAAYVYRWDAVAWNQEAKLIASDASAYDYFGSSVSLGHDFLLVGAYGVDEVAGGAGAAYAFGRTGASWFEDNKYVASDGAGDDAYGTAVATDGASLIVGAAGYASGAGAAYAFTASSDFHRFVLLAERSIELFRQADFAGDIHSNAWIDFRDGNPSQLNGNVTAVGDVTIGRGQTVNGDVTVGATVTLDPQATVTGTVTEGAAVDPLPLPAFAFTAGGSDVRVRPWRLVVLLPGVWGDVVVGNRSVLVLLNDGTTGDYFFDSLVVQNRASLLVSVRRGPVHVNVVGDVDFRTRSSVINWPFSNAAASQTVFNVIGSAAMGSDTSIRGLFNVPYGNTYMAPRAALLGVICADSIRIARDAQLALPPTTRDFAPAIFSSPRETPTVRTRSRRP